MAKQLPTQKQVFSENEDLRARLEIAEETLREILSGEADALFVQGVGGRQVFTLKGADQSYRTLIESMSEGALTMTAEGMIVYANRCFAAMLRTPLEKVIGSEIHTWFAPESRQALQTLLQKDVGGNRREELTLAAADGTQVLVYLSVNRLVLNEMPDSFCMIATDLTEQKHNEAILAGEKLARAILEQAADAIVICDETGRIIRASKQAQAFYAKNPLGQLFEHAFPLRQLDGTAFSPLGALDSSPRQSVEARLECNGKEFDLLVSVGHLKGARSELLGSVVTLTDITERKRAEEQTADALRELSDVRAALDGHAIVAITDAKGKITYVNGKFCEISGYSRAELLGKDHRVINSGFHSREFMRSLWQTISDGRVWQGEIKNKAKDGTFYWVDATIMPYLGEDGKPIQYIAIRTDITERKGLEQTLQETNVKLESARVTAEKANLAKDEFLSHVSHELRSPLTAIKQFSSILLGGLAGELNKEQYDYQEIVLKNVGQLQAMIDDLLEVTRLETGKLTVEAEIVSLAVAVTDIINTVEGTARAKGVTLSCDLPADLPRGHADRTRLRQILIILLDNAIKFTPVGGAITIHARLFEQDSRFLVVEVSDTGYGLSPEIAEKIFERLYQVAGGNPTSRKGLGLGLYICKELVTRQGGQIWVKSELEKGSTFSFTLPVFSLNTVLAPLLRDDKWPAESVALVMVETHLKGAWPSKESQEGWVREARGLLQRCLWPDVDLLLPQMGSGAAADRFFVAVFADEKGVSVFANRIRQKFERLPHLEQTGLTVSVSCRMLAPVAGDVGASKENILTSMATSLEAAIQSQINSEVDHA